MKIILINKKYYLLYWLEFTKWVQVLTVHPTFWNYKHDWSVVTSTHADSLVPSSVYQRLLGSWFRIGKFGGHMGATEDPALHSALPFPLFDERKCEAGRLWAGCEVWFIAILVLTVLALLLLLSLLHLPLHFQIQLIVKSSACPIIITQVFFHSDEWMWCSLVRFDSAE